LKPTSFRRSTIKAEHDVKTHVVPTGLSLQSRRDGSIVAWHEVPGTAQPQKSRPVGYGLIRAGMRTDSTIGVIGLS
jgi:hypothetical protein